MNGSALTEKGTLDINKRKHRENLPLSPHFAQAQAGLIVQEEKKAYTLPRDHQGWRIMARNWRRG